MTARYPIPAARHTVETVARRSRFIATVDQAPTVEAARALLAEMRRRYPDATHHVHAFAVGFGANVVHGASDDGEPPGTAGRPTLAVVAGSGLGDVCVVTTRYYGGTKLGAGGLVKGYTEAAQAALDGVPRAMREERRTVHITARYADVDICLRLAESHDGRIAEREFGADVGLSVSLPADRVAAFEAALVEATAGRVVVDPAER